MVGLRGREKTITSVAEIINGELERIFDDCNSSLVGSPPSENEFPPKFSRKISFSLFLFFFFSLSISPKSSETDEA